ncbi:MAG: NAD(P)/FAD-dependent oxidoreductase [Aquificaceae bacterium]|nr:NAD(P)/FAD-dependent oxidoreductase [Aquificaceae bacterium]
MKKVEVLVVGGGPAGSTCAYQLAKSGLKVLLVDIKRRIGTPVQCAEFVPIQLKKVYGEFFSENAIAQSVENMLHFLPWGEGPSLWSEGYILNREVFDYHIAKLAELNGAEVLLRTKFLVLEDGLAWLENIDTRERFAVAYEFLVGADGPKSKVAKLTGESVEDFLTTAQITLPLKVSLKDLLIYFRDYIPGGYGWLFPKGDVANLGVGVDPYYGMPVMESLRRFIKELLSYGLVEGKVLKRTGGWIPAGGLINVVRGRVLLVGDAGGFCHPITGAGIANAVISGSMAAKAIIEGKTQNYREEAEDTFAESLGRAVEKRKKYIKSWDNLRDIIPRIWIAFKEYWSE